MPTRPSVVAYHEVRPGISIFTRLHLIRMDEAEQTLYFTAGVRALGDTTLALGSRLVVKESDLRQNDAKTVYHLKVEKVDTVAGDIIHQARIVNSVSQHHERAHARYDLELDAFRNNNLRFRTRNISSKGLQLHHSATLTSALLNEKMAVYLNINRHNVQFDCRPRYIIYNWWENSHVVGAEFVNITASQQQVIDGLLSTLAPADFASAKDNLSEMLDTIHHETPPPVLAAVGAATPADDEPEVAKDEPSKVQKTLIDPASGRIRFDRL